ncbi:MAG: hypothetical protein HQK53_17805 [Oligoflexia bacterium]|nr:hypothetical protein [Oligoflexia bacterium]
MKGILILSLLFFVSGCASRSRVLPDKKSSDHWTEVNNPKESLTKKELQFLRSGQLRGP